MKDAICWATRSLSSCFQSRARTPSTPGDSSHRRTFPHSPWRGGRYLGLSVSRYGAALGCRGSAQLIPCPFQVIQIQGGHRGFDLTLEPHPGNRIEWCQRWEGVRMASSLASSARVPSVWRKASQPAVRPLRHRELLVARGVVCYLPAAPVLT